MAIDESITTAIFRALIVIIGWVAIATSLAYLAYRWIINRWSVDRNQEEFDHQMNMRKYPPCSNCGETHFHDWGCFDCSVEGKGVFATCNRCDKRWIMMIEQPNGEWYLDTTNPPIRSFRQVMKRIQLTVQLQDTSGNTQESPDGSDT
ncbi:MAG: hypothetical protein KDA52_05670 [Planctomycetaceae bacterium]|nr:hypothetical protein [Planctomycetaceae bacterium]